MRRTLAAIGRMLVTIGLLILLFVTYELWGTGIFTARDQARLKSQFHKELLQAHNDDPVVTVPTSTPKPGRPHPTTTTTFNPKYEVAPPEGGIVGEIVIKKIGVDWIVREGVQLADLAQGPGHYPGTPLPGQIGNAAIAGHRTTHGAPFYNVNELAPGDQIQIRTFAGTYTYVVYKTPFPVDPTDYGVVANTPDAELTLTSCNPRYSARQRIVIKAKLLRKAERQAARPADSHQRQEGRSAAAGAAGDGTPGRVEQRPARAALGLHRRDRRRAVVVGVPPLAPPAHVGGRRHPVPGGALPVLRVPGTGPPQRLLNPRLMGAWVSSL